MKKNINKLVTIFVLLIFITQPFSVVAGQSNDQLDTSTSMRSNLDSNVLSQLDQIKPDEQVQYPSDTNMGDELFDNNNSYKQVWDPWKTKAAIHAIATTDDGDMMALASGYLYDDQVHLYRWNYETSQYDLVWEVGGGVFQSDVLDIEFADTNHNNLTEIVAAGEDGRLYVFEQKHIYDPITNTENQFELVWKSDRLGRIFDVVVEDTDGDYKQDIIVGTGDTVRWFEYFNHSGYPFNTEHWIEFDESFSYKMPDHVTSLAVADTNQNGLKEIVTGMRSGEIQLLENNGTILDINGADYPIMQNNNYDSIWSSGISIQRQINDMSTGDLDGDQYREVLISAQGQGAYILDKVDGVFGTFRIQRDYAGWESDPNGAYPLDTYADWMINSSSLLSVDGSFDDFTVDNFTYVADPNVYFEFSGDPEPLDNAASEAHNTIYPYRTAMAQPADNNYTVFTAKNRPAWAIMDWGRHEEASGNGITTLYDMIIHSSTTSPSTDTFTIELSQDGVNWVKVPKNDVARIGQIGKDKYHVEVDTVLNSQGWNYYRYMKINVTTGELKIDSFETRYFNKPIYDVQSTTVGEMMLKGKTSATTVGYLGTVDGAILALAWNSTTDNYEIVWDSWVDERYKLSTNIFDLELLKSKGNTFPAWIDEGDQTFSFTPRTTSSQITEVFSYDVENFYNYREENNLEFVYTNFTGEIMLATQSSPVAKPKVSQDLTKLLFDTDVIGLGNLLGSVGVQATVQDWMDTQYASYYSASLVSLDTTTPQPGSIQYNLTESGYFLFLSKWDGKLNASTRDPGTVDVSVWYLQNIPDQYASQLSVCDSVPRCSFFAPVFNNFTETQMFQAKTIGNSEQSGQLEGVLAQSSWAPSLQAYDVFDSGHKDLIMANGKLSLLEVSQSTGSRLVTSVNTLNEALNKVSDLQTVYHSGYFKEINEDSKGRIWSKVEPVDFDNDGDMDLYLGYARSDDFHFGIDKPTYGFTYWENQGTAEDPIWVEQKKAVTNNDPASNFRVEGYTDPVLTYEDHDFSGGFDENIGFHPALRSTQPSRMFMFQDPTPVVDEDITQNRFIGTIEQFSANYDPPTSMLAATYPEATRLDINLQYDVGDSRAVNYGYHIVKSWDNSEELKQWTLSLDTADLDQDGNKEVIVGDFNNNMFVFEHLTNNTFKRAFKSDDLNRTLLTDESPYANEKFDGIGGTFYRTIFQHAKLLIAGTDLNQNDLQEVILATDNMIFVFESYRTPGGRIRQDSFKLVNMIDMFDQLALTGMAQEDIQITALATANDMNLDDRHELLVGVGPALLVFEIDPAGTSPYTTFMPHETFFGATGALKGQYKLPGNYYLYPELQINSILVQDVDRSGYLDIILAGVDRTNALPIQDGFIHIFEANSLGYETTILYEKEFAKVTAFNPIHDIDTGDHDYDGLTELYVAHDSGIDVFEFPVPGRVIHQQTITSDPHYTLPTRNYDIFLPLYPQTASQFQDADFSHDKDIVRINSTTLAQVYIAPYYIDGDEELDYAVVVEYSNDDGSNWGNYEIIADSTGSPKNFVDLSSPRIAINYQSLMVAWANRTFDTESGDYYTDIYVARKLQGSNPWNYIANLAGPKIVQDTKEYVAMDIFSSYRSTSYEIGLAFVNGSQLVMGEFNTASSLDRFDGIFMPEFADGDKNDTDFFIHSLDITFVGDRVDTSFPLNQQNFSMVFSGYQYNESLAMDYDLFHVPFWMPLDEQYNFTERPTRTFSSGYNAFYPSIMTELDTNRLLVTFVQPSSRIYGGMYSIWSNDLGFSWQGPYDMAHPLAIDQGGGSSINRKVIPVSTESGTNYRVMERSGAASLEDFVPRMPVVTLNSKGGYTMLYSAQVTFRIPPNYRYGICGGTMQLSAQTNSFRGSLSLSQQATTAPVRTIQQSAYLGCTTAELTKVIRVSAVTDNLNFTRYTVGGVTDIALGDSDQDGREEILAASDKNAFLFEFNENGETFIDHRQKWVSPEYFYGVSAVAFDDVNGNGFDNLLISSERGTVHSYELINLQVNTTDIEPTPYTSRGSVVPANAADPFLYIGEEFTKQSTFLLHNVTGDRYDDVILIDENYIGVADTGRLVTEQKYEEALWQITDKDFGKYLGKHVLADIDNDGDEDIIVAYSYIIIAFDLKTGSQLWNTTAPAERNRLYGHIRDLQMVFGDFDSNNKGTEVAITYQIRKSIFKPPGTEIALINSASGYIYESALLDEFRGGRLALADIDADSYQNLIFTTFNHTNRLHTKIFAWPYDLSNPYQIIDYIGQAPVTDIKTGEFSNDLPGEEFMIVMDHAALGFYKGFNYRKLPAWTWTFGYNGTHLGTTPTYHAEAPFRGRLLNSYIVDANGDGYDDFIGQRRDGSLYSVLISGTTDYEYKDIDTYTDSPSVPYGDGNVLVGDYCGTATFFTQKSATSISCYDTLDFSSKPQPLYTSSNIDLDIIVDLVGGDLDGDGNADDVLMVGRNGFVWIFNNDWDLSSLDQSIVVEFEKPKSPLGIHPLNLVLVATLIAIPIRIKYRRKYTI